MSESFIKKLFARHERRSESLRPVDSKRQPADDLVASPMTLGTTNVYRPRIDLYVPFDQKDRAKQRGARWDAKRKIWFVPEGIDAAPFFEWRPQAPKFNLRSVGYFIAKSSQTCWQCQNKTGVFSFVLPVGHEIAEPVDEEDEGFGPNDNYDDAAFLAWIDSAASSTWEPQEAACVVSNVTLLPSSVITRVMLRTVNYRVDFSKTAESSYWMNHCDNCGAKQGDFQLYHEPGGAFFPMDQQDAEGISLERIGEPFFCAGDQIFGGMTQFFDGMRLTS